LKTNQLKKYYREKNSIQKNEEKIDTNTNWQDLFDLWKGLHKIWCEEKENIKEKKKVNRNPITTPPYTNV